MKEIVAGNLTRYRKGLNLSQEELAHLAGVTRQSINNYENAKTLPDSKTLSALAGVLSLKLDDLLRQQNAALPNFRFRAHTSFDKKPQFAAQVLRHLVDYTALEQAVGMPPYAPESTPCHQVEGNEKRIAAIATQFRHRLGLGDAPIPNLFEAVEEIGLKVVRQDIPIPGFFGLSACSLEQGAFVLVNSHNISIERQLFTVAHEIGHLIFHRGEYQDTLIEQGTKEEKKAREAVANHFASHLLVSQEALDRALNVFTNLIELKAHFRVSYTMMLIRLDQGVSVAVEQKCTVRTNSCDNDKNRTLSNNIVPFFEQVPGIFSCDKSHYHRNVPPNCGLLKLSPHKCFRLSVHFCSIATHAPNIKEIKR